MENECQHWFREFRVETGNGRVSCIWFYCQKCLKIERKTV